MEFEQISSLLARIRQRPPAEQEAFKWLILMALADGNWLQPEGTEEYDGRKLYLFREPASGQLLAAFRPDIDPEQEEGLRQGMQAILADIGPPPEGGSDGAGK